MNDLVRIIASAPCRLDPAGGWTDGCTAFCDDGQPILGKVCNIAIKRRSFIELTLPANSGIWVKCDGDHKQLTWNSQYYGRLDLFVAAYRRFDLGQLLPSTIQYDWIHDRSPRLLEIIATSEVPFSSGLGGSATVAVPLAAALMHFLNKTKPTDSSYEDWVAREARGFELDQMKVSSGWQDQGAAVYGGISFFEAKTDPQKPIRYEITRDSEIVSLLEDSLLLIKTPKIENRSSNQVHQKVRNLEEKRRVQLLQDMTMYAEICRDAILASDMCNFGEAVRNNWEAIKELTSGDSTSPYIDRLVSEVLSLGAYGAKACGAGGPGGAVMIVTRPEVKEIILNTVSGWRDFEVLPVKIDFDGLQIEEVN